MSTVSRSNFIKDLDRTGINVNDMDPQTQEKLKKANISQKDLMDIAGEDGQIRGAKEYSELFNRVVRHDSSSPDTNSFENSGKSGEAYEALKSEVDRNMTKAQSQGVIHLGMRPQSVHEANALAKANPAANGGVVRIEGYRSEGVVKYDGKSYDLKNTAGLEKFRDALTTGPDKMPKEKAQKFVDQLGTVQADGRDEVAQLGLTFHRAGKGELPVNRLVMSGHGDVNGTLMGDKGEKVRLADLESLSRVFPEGAKKIEHVAISACFCAGHANFEELKRTFPNLKSAFAYNQQSPLAETEAPAHLTKWEAMTHGKDPSQVDPLDPKTKTATWNSVDGTQGLSNAKLEVAEDTVKQFAYAHEAYKTGKKDRAQATHDPELDLYYVSLAELQRHPDISPERKAEVDTIRREVLKLRHPELTQ
jgi:hypothetical protein